MTLRGEWDRNVRWGIRFRDGSVSHTFNGRTARQRCEERIKQDDATYAPDTHRLVRSVDGGPWELAHDDSMEFTRRQFLEYQSIMAGATWWAAREAVASWGIEHAEVDMDDEKLTWAQWEAEPHNV